MIGPTRTLARGLAAGAAGTTALNAATYVDMAVRGRGESEMPKKSVETIAGKVGAEVPGDGATRENRVSGLGALSGIATGAAAGVAAALAGPLLRRLPVPVSAVLIGGAAMAGSDVPMTRLGLTDPKSWSAPDWLADGLPHLAYGFAAAWTLRALQPDR